MTIIESERQSPLNAALAVLTILLVASLFGLVITYNKLVNAEHTQNVMAKDIRKFQGENAELQDKIFELTTSARLEAIAAERSLVKDRAPRYLSIGEPWSIASQ